MKGFILIICLVSTYYSALPGYAQDSFRDNTYWSPFFSPPALFLNPYNIEVTNDLVIVSGQRFAEGASSISFGSVYKAISSDIYHHFGAEGWEEATLYAGETRIFARRGGVVGQLAEINITDGSASRIPFPGTGSRFAVFNDTLHTLTNGQVQRFNGTSWESIGPQLSPLNSLNSWTGDNTGVYLAVGPGTLCDIEHCITTIWHLVNGSWTEIGQVKGFNNPPVSEITLDSQHRLIVVGDFDQLNGIPIQRAARWDGKSWEDLGNGIAPEIGFLTDVASVDTLIYTASTENIFLEWDGVKWDSLGIRSSRFITELNAQGNRLFASGWFVTIDDIVAYRVAEWNASSKEWMPVFPVLGEGIDGEVRILIADTKGGIYAGGNFPAAGSTKAHNIAYWNGQQWQSVGAGIQEPVDALIATPSMLYAGTYNGVAEADIENPSWEYVPAITDGRTLRRVTDFAILNDQVFAAGIATDDTRQVAGVFRLDAGRWEMIGDPFVYGNFAGYPRKLATDGEDLLFAAGEFTHTGEIEAHNIAAWNGSQWQAVGSGLTHPVTAIEYGNGKLYTGSTNPDSLFSWDIQTQTWDGIPIPNKDYFICNPVVNSLLHRSDGLYAGFGKECILTGKSTSSKNVAFSRWDGEKWEIPGSGIENADIKSIAAAGDYLFIGGEFEVAGEKPSYNIARWDGRIRLSKAPVIPSPIARLDQNFPNPFSTSTSITFRFEQPATNARLEVFDMLGRKVATLLDETLLPGSYTAQFKGDELAGGLYIYRLTADEYQWSRKFLVVR